MRDRMILVVESDANLRAAIKTALTTAGYDCTEAENERAAMNAIVRARPQLVLCQIDKEPEKSLELLGKIRRTHSDIAVMFMTDTPTAEMAVNVMRRGAVDYISKRFEPDELLETIKPYFSQITSNTNEPVARDARSAALLTLAKRVALSEATVLISGASGTGKEVLAQYIHTHSRRKDKPFVAINCAAIPENMLEATLFGYEKGAFTGAYKSMPGKFEQAQGGTLLLDEISEMDLALQAKLLRVLQERELERLGSSTTVKLDVRVLATTNRHMREEVRAGRFREDLFYRINVFPLHWLPLRERPEDILPMAQYILDLHASGLGKAIPAFSAAAKQALLAHTWPGNAREMDNVIQRALILVQGDQIEVDDLQLEHEECLPVYATPVKGAQLRVESSTGEAATAGSVNGAINSAPAMPAMLPGSAADSLMSCADNLKDNVKIVEFQRIMAALDEFDGDRKSVAQSLGISERTLRYKMAKMRDHGTMV